VWSCANIRGRGATGNKSDRIDADRLSELLRLRSLKAVYHGAGGLPTLKELVRGYVNLLEDSANSLRITALFRAPHGTKDARQVGVRQSPGRAGCHNSPVTPYVPRRLPERLPCPDFHQRHRHCENHNHSCPCQRRQRRDRSPGRSGSHNECLGGSQLRWIDSESKWIS
jgi:hypothetical protein